MSNELKMIDQLNAPASDQRLAALRRLDEMIEAGEITGFDTARDVNNHIHTTYSFSPYTPTKAVWMAAKAGLETAGIMDHDSISGAREFLQAAGIIGLPVTVGAEMRASFAGTALEGRRINNPDQPTIAYVALHGVPHSRIDALNAFFEPVRRARAVRNGKMTRRLSALLEPCGLSLDYEQDVVSLSSGELGGEVTERHLLFAAAGKMLRQLPDRQSIIRLLTETLGMDLVKSQKNRLLDQDNGYVQYDLLGVLKGSLVSQFYIEATGDECPPISEVADFARENGIVLAYAYLGDVKNSVTGDKRDQTFEDSYLDEVFKTISDAGLTAVTYMPSRNTREQLERLRSLCVRHNLFQISGEDINSPRQAFVCEMLRDPFFANLRDSAWALIGHELAATDNLNDGMFSRQSIERQPDLNKRIKQYADLARERLGKTDLFRRNEDG